MCRWHFRVIDALTRNTEVPEIATMKIHQHGLYATIDPHNQVLFVTDLFAEKPPEYQVFVLAHEQVHIWLRREFGRASSLAFDLIYKRPIQCLGFHSLLTWELNLLYGQSETANL